MSEGRAYRDHVATAPALAAGAASGTGSVGLSVSGAVRTPSLLYSVAHSGEAAGAAPTRRPRAHTLPEWAGNRDAGVETRPRAGGVAHLSYPFSLAERGSLPGAAAWLAPDVVLPALDEALLAARSAGVREALERTQLARRQCGALEDAAAAARAQLEEIAAAVAAAAADMAALERANDDGVSEQLTLDAVYTDVTAALDVYENLESLTRLLNRPGTKVASRAAELHDVLAQIDAGLAFCRAHPTFKDMDLYELRYKQCLVRALSLAQEYVTGRLRTVFFNIRDRLAKLAAVTGGGTGSTSASTSAASALIWTKFEADAAQLRPIVDVLAARPEPEYENLFVETCEQYFGFRSQLLAGEIAKLLPTASTPDLLSTFHSTVTQFKELYDLERSLFEAVIAPAEGARLEQLESWLIGLSEPLYDVLRSYIIRETSIPNLCQILIALQANSEDARWTRVTDPIFQDAQNRLVFRADSIIEGVTHYEPTKKDLTRRTYPTVETATQLLDQIAQLISHLVFSDLTHRCVHQCVLSLDIARRRAEQQLGRQRSELFYIQQLSVLQARIVDFDVESAQLHEVDFSGLQSLVDAIRQNGARQLFSFREFLDMAWTSVPKVVEYMFDSMEELYNRLQATVEAFNEHTLETLSDPIAKNDPRTAIEDTSQLKELLQEAIPQIQAMVSEQVTDPKVADALLETLQERVVHRYSDYYSTIYASGAPDQLQDVQDTETFAAWLARLILRHAREHQIDEGAHAVAEVASASERTSNAGSEATRISSQAPSISAGRPVAQN